MIRHLALSLLALASASAWAVDGLPDSTFGILSSGKNFIPLNLGGSNADSTVDVLVAANRSIFVVGTARAFPGQSRFAVTKLTPNGIVDPSFGTNGTVFSATANVVASRARLDAAGNIVVVGTADFAGTDKDFHICRYSPQGQPVSFQGVGSNCRTIAFDVGAGNHTDEAYDFVIDSSGRFIIVGSAGISATNDLAAITRLTANGQIDAAFSGDGRLTRSFVEGGINRYYALAERPDGKFYAVGEAGDSQATNGTSMLFTRLAVAGNPDTSFNNGTGFALYNIDDGAPFHRDDAGTSVAVLSDGNILVGGSREVGSGANQSSAFVFKILPLDFPGLDTTFGNSGRLYYGNGYHVDFNRMLVQSDDKIVLAGSTRTAVNEDSLMHVIRLRPNGTLDTFEFGTIGRVDVDFFLPGNDDFGTGVASQDGSLIVAGHSANQNATDLDQTVTRLHNDLIFADDLE